MRTFHQTCDKADKLAKKRGECLYVIEEFEPIWDGGNGEKYQIINDFDLSTHFQGISDNRILYDTDYSWG